ncbi:MAG: hypothetical protein ABIZ05_09190 [Pseudonocardiaceae bacterium]
MTRPAMVGCTRPRLTLGVYGPGCPSSSGVARYIQASLPYLREHYDVTHVGEDTAWDPSSFDVVLYHLGNNVLHHSAFRALRRRPGPVLLHEYNNLNYYYEAWQRLDDDERAAVLAMLGRCLGGAFGHRDDLERHLAGHPHVDRYSLDSGIESLAVSAATRTLVHSPEAAAVLVGRYPRARVDVLPFPVGRIPEGNPAAVRARLGIAPDTYVFATFGFIGEYKRVEQILTAWQSWSDRPAEALLLLVGATQYDIQLPDEPCVRHTGYLADDDFDALVVAVDCGIQLRHPWLGETSGPTSMLLAHQRPLICTGNLAGQTGVHDSVLLVPTGTGEVAALVEAMRSQHRRPTRPSRYDSAWSWDTWTSAVTHALAPAPEHVADVDISARSRPTRA